MRYFKLKNPFRNVKLMLREIDNYYYFIRQLEILKDSGELKHYVLKRKQPRKHYEHHTLQGKVY